MKGQWVWIKPPKVSEFATPIGCQIIRFDRGKVLIRNDDGHESWIKPDQVEISFCNLQKNAPLTQSGDDERVNAHITN